jgi:hypothetical protein
MVKMRGKTSGTLSKDSVVGVSPHTLTREKRGKTLGIVSNKDFQQAVSPLSISVSSFEDIKKLKNRINNRCGALKKQEPSEFRERIIRELVEDLAYLDDMKKRKERNLGEELRGHYEIYGTYLKRIKGIGVSLSGSLIYYAEKYIPRTLNEKGHGFSSFAHVAGVIPGTRKQKGMKATYDTSFQTKLIGPQGVVDEFVMHKTQPYRDFYDTVKANYKNKYPDGIKAHIEKMTRRKVARRFLKDFYKKWLEYYPDGKTGQEITVIVRKRL